MEKLRLEHRHSRILRPADACRLVRSFVQTNDPRSPLVTVWTIAQDIADESELARPAMNEPLFWRAFQSLRNVVAVTFSPAAA